MYRWKKTSEWACDHTHFVHTSTRRAWLATEKYTCRSDMGTMTTIDATHTDNETPIKRDVFFHNGPHPQCAKTRIQPHTQQHATGQGESKLYTVDGRSYKGRRGNKIHSGYTDALLDSDNTTRTKSLGTTTERVLTKNNSS